MTKPVMKMIARGGMLVVLVALAGTAFAQNGGGSAPPGGAAAGATPAPAAPSEPPAAVPAQPSTAAPAADPAAAPAAASSAGDARKLCTAAMNADPQFAAAIVKTADEKAALQRDADTLAAHTDASAHVQKNEQHVIYAYAAMWIVAAGFVLFLWRRQQALQAEIANLRRDLEAAGSGAPAGEARA
jgi:hypothetical protein